MHGLRAATGTAQIDEVRFPAYLMKGEVVEVDGKYYTIPEPVAFNTVKELVVYLYENRVEAR